VNRTYPVDLVANAFAQNLNPVFGDRTLNNLGSIDIAQLSGGRESVITRVDYIIGNDSGGTGGGSLNRASLRSQFPIHPPRSSPCSPSLG
jgi:hypothetical protein